MVLIFIIMLQYVQKYLQILNFNSEILGDNFSLSNAIPTGRGEQDWPIRILACHLTYHLNPIWHTWPSETKVVASVLWARIYGHLLMSFRKFQQDCVATGNFHIPATEILKLFSNLIIYL
jgi:hypothetical protein